MGNDSGFIDCCWSRCCACVVAAIGAIGEKAVTASLLNRADRANTARIVTPVTTTAEETAGKKEESDLALVLLMTNR